MRTNESEISVQLFGDLALTARYADPFFREAFSTNVAFIKERLPQADLRIVNWEAPVIEDQPPNPEKLLTISTTTEAAESVGPLGFDVALLANNHTFDYLEAGYAATKSVLESKGLKTLGAGLTEIEARSPLVVEVKGQSLAILNYVDPGTNPAVPKGAAFHLNILDPKKVLTDVETLAGEGHSVIVNIHWGMDFIGVPSPDHVRLARDAIKAGAVIVAGHHAHCIQGYERVEGGVIFYGLGNFLAGGIYPWPRFTEPAMVVTCRIEKRKVSGFGIHPFILKNEILHDDPLGRVARALTRLNRLFELSPANYRRKFSQALAYNLAVVRPAHFLRRNRNPLKIFGLLKKRHAHEYLEIIRTMISK